jgi:serine/threonine protein phosphatase PrpC
MDDLVTIGEFSERSGLSAKRLRTYATAGLLVPAAVDSSSGYRYYAPGQLREARAIDALRRAGVALADIATVLRDPSPEQLDEWARQVELDQAERHEALHLARQLLAVGGDTIRADGPDDATREANMDLRTAARTDIGRVRASNEDSTLCCDGLVAVADGMGGHPGGEIASSLAVAVVEAAFTGRSADELEAAARAANRAVFERAAADEQLDGSGTTLCAVGLTNGGDLAVVNVGDSRAYLFRNGSLQRLTDDHSITGELVQRGELTEREAADHPLHGILTRALGVAKTVEVDTVVRSAHAGDRLLVCSDGLFNEVPEQVMQSLLETTEDPERAADLLVDHALSNGGHDNVTVVIADVLTHVPVGDMVQAETSERR